MPKSGVTKRPQPPDNSQVVYCYSRVSAGRLARLDDVAPSARRREMQYQQPFQQPQRPPKPRIQGWLIAVIAGAVLSMCGVCLSCAVLTRAAGFIPTSATSAAAGATLTIGSGYNHDGKGNLQIPPEAVKTRYSYRDSMQFVLILPKPINAPSFEIVFAHETGGEPISAYNFDVESTNSQFGGEITSVGVALAPFPSPGSFVIEALVRGQYVAQTRFQFTG